jgi:hypothetical protein
MMPKRKFKKSAHIIVGLALCMAGCSWAGGYSVLAEQKFQLDAPRPHPLSLARTADGGYIVAGTLSWRAFAIKTNASLDRIWQIYLMEREATYLANTVISTPDGGSILAGQTRIRGEKGSALNAPFAAKLDHAGNVVWNREYGSQRGLEGNGGFACGAATRGGILLIGMRYKLWHEQPTRTGAALGSQLWITKLNKQGEVEWEKGIAVDGSDLVTPLLLQKDNCARPIEEESGAVVFAISTATSASLVRDGRRIVAGPEIAYQDRRVLLVFKMDRKGRELARLRLADGNIPRLFANKDGYVLIDNNLKKGARGVRETFINGDLKVSQQHALQSGGPYFYMEAALPDEHGGFHLAGYYTTPPAERGRSAMAYLNDRGELIDLTQFGWALPSWQPIALANRGNARFVLLRQNKKGGIELSTLNHQR